MSNTHEHLEHAEHAQHAAHDPFATRVAMTMAIVAACLASVTLLSHREHNQTILEQAQAATYHTQASDQWAFYQAKNIRQHEYNAMVALLGCLSKDVVQEEGAKKARDEWVGVATRYKNKDLPDIMDKAKGLETQAKEHEKFSHVAHKRSNFFDGGELFIELALVLCSIAILTKMRGFWYSGMVICTIGVVVALLPFTPLFSSLFTHDDHEGHGEQPPASTAPESPGKHSGH